MTLNYARRISYFKKLESNHCLLFSLIDIVASKVVGNYKEELAN